VVILQLDEPGLFVYPNAEAAVRDIEAIDIEESLRLAYDDSGRRLEVEWIEPNQRTGAGLFASIQNGKYRLVPSEKLEPEVLAALLLAAPYFDPPTETRAMLDLAEDLRSGRNR
jgi:hypothetical protein